MTLQPHYTASVLKIEVESAPEHLFLTTHISVSLKAQL